MKYKFLILTLITFALTGILSFSNNIQKKFFQQATNLIPSNSLTTYTSISNRNASISSEKAKEIALTHAKVPKHLAKFKKIQIDVEHGLLVYEIEFLAGNYEFEYEIDANTGRIISFEIEY